MNENKVKSDKFHTAVNICTGIIVLIFNLGVSFFVSPYIVKSLGEEANGFTQLANNFVTYASLITVAFNSMAGRFISVCYHKNDIEGVNKYFSSTMICNLIITAIFAPIATVIVWRLQNIIVIENANVMDVKILFACVFINFFISLDASVYNIAMFVKNELFIQNICSLIKSILNACVLLVIFALFPPKIYFISVVAIVWTILLAIANYIIHNRLMPELKINRRYFSLKAIKSMLASGIWNTVNQCGHLLMTGLDLIVTDLFVSPSAMGMLAVAKTVPTAITSLASTLNTNLAPSLTRAWAEENHENLMKTIKSGMKISCVIVSIPLMVFCAHGVEFYKLWMPSLDAKQLTLLSFLSCMALVPWAGPQVLNNIFSATNRLKVNTITFCGAGLLNVLIVFILLKYTKLELIAIAGTSSVITIIRCLTIVAPYIAHLLNVKWYTFYKDVLISLLCCGINYGVSKGIALLFNADSWSILFLAVLVSCILTFAIDFFVILSKKERDMLLKRILRK